ncbi:unnamed protein product [Nesidiocoris tenuis]|uniref:Uncharacterized protein n=1 Tax=Nesidiocoris tenuis TaxID=355587 RepID=A0A6H5GJX7_9HEMI|nr:unnamed protein product [Nesidiocoris tenuis]
MTYGSYGCYGTLCVSSVTAASETLDQVKRDSWPDEAVPRMCAFHLSHYSYCVQVV